MNHKRVFLVSALVAVGLTLVPAGVAGEEKNAAESRPTYSSFEVQERRVDRAALDSQLNAIRSLQELIGKNRGKEQESALLFKLGEAQRRAGSMQFRIAHGTPAQGGGKAGLQDHKQYLIQSTKTFGQLIQRFPRSSDLPRAYFLKGRSHSESGSPSLARADFLHLVSNFPKSEDTISAYMALAEIAMDKNQWDQAAEYLRPVEKDRSNPHYPHALYRQAWCQYNLKDVPRALSYAERTIRYYSGRGQSRSDEALRENAILDAALFFLQGYEQRLSHFGVDEAYTYFKRLESGAILGKVIVRYAKLLRAHGHVEELGKWKTLVLSREPERPENLELIVIAYEDQLNKRQYIQLVDTARELVSYRNPKSSKESVERAERLLLDAAKQLQQLISKNKNADGVVLLTTALAGIYDCFTRLVDEEDPRVAKVHYNLAESLFEIGQYEQATEHYRWVLNKGWEKEASLRAIGSRYEHLRKRGLIPKDLKARSIQESPRKDLDKDLVEWIGWVDDHAKRTAMSVDSFYFEANRAIYLNGDIQDSLKRLLGFALEFPKSKYATPSATLLVDTYVASAEWEKLQELSAKLLAIKEWKGTEFATRLYGLAADAEFKTVEAAYRAGDYKLAIGKSERFRATYPESKRHSESLAIAGHAALAAKDTSEALGYFSQLMRTAPNSEAGASALLAHGGVREEQLEFTEAARDFQQYLAMPPAIAKLGDKQRNDLRRKTLAYAWISGDSKLLNRVLADKSVCTPAVSGECQRYEVLKIFESQGRGPDFTAKAFSRARHGAVEYRSLWAALALEGARNLAFRDRHVAIRILRKHWDALDSLAKTYILPSVTLSIPRAIAMNRRSIRSVAPLMAREAYLVRRVEAIREIENAGMEAAKLPWARIRASITNELADLYADTARSLRSLRGADPAMAEPFEKKSDSLRAKAFELASSSAIEDDAFDEIAQPYLHADPKRMARLLPKVATRKPEPLDPGQLRTIDPDGDWGNESGQCKDSSRCAVNALKARWYHAARQRRWAEAAYLVQYAKEKKLVSPTVLALLRAYTLAGVGAQAEALAELAGARGGMDKRIRRNVNRLLLEHYQNSLAHDRAGELMKELGGDPESIAQTDQPKRPAAKAGG